MGLSVSNFETITGLIESENYTELRNLLQNGTITKDEIEKLCSEPNSEDAYGRTLIHRSVWREDSQALEIFFEFCQNVKLESKDIYGMTPLAASVNRGNVAGAAILLDKNASVDCDKHNGYFLLRTAVYNNKLEMVDLLLKNNCQTKETKTDMEHGSLLHIACDAGNIEIMKLLVQKGNISIDVTDRFNIQGVHIAASKNFLEIMKYLIENGADINAEDSLGNVPLGWAHFSDSHDLVKYLKDLNAIDKPFKNLEKPEKVECLKQNLTKNDSNFKEIDLKILNPYSLEAKNSLNNQIEMKEVEAARQEKPNQKNIEFGVVNLSFQELEK